MDKKLADIVKDVFDVQTDVVLTRPDAEFGDYTTNIALQLAGKVGKSPREIAEAVAAKLRESGDFADVQVAGPGFINLHVSDQTLTTELAKMIDQGQSYGKPAKYAGKKVVTEYSDPNPFKVLHAGHLYTSVIGDAISNLIEMAGGDVHRVNFGGDVGLHVGKTMYVILQRLHGENPDRLADIPEEKRSEWLAECYVEGTNAYEDDEQAKVEIIALNKRVYQLHADNDHESPFAHIYWTTREWSYTYFDQFYARIGSDFEKYYPESETSPIGLATVREQLAHGVYKESDGAVVFEGEPYGLHTRVFINSEGLPTYEAKDVGLSIKKWEDYHYDESVIITGNDITEYMKVVLKSMEQFQPELVNRTRHLTHGNVKLAGGVKMSSRKGNILRAVDVIEAAADENEQAQGNRDDAPVLGAIKYAFLKNRLGGDVVYDPKESVSLQGNSGPYLQYTLARATSITQKVTKEPTLPDAPVSYDSYERALLVKLTGYPETLQLAVNELAPHHVCTYLYELAQAFNRFYEKSRVVGDEREVVRIQLVTAYAHILKSGLTLLGIPTPERM